MIEIPTFPMVSALQGGVSMSSFIPPRSPSRERQVAPSQVWASLSADLRTHTIGLLAQLALNVIVARNTEPCGKEMSHAHTPEHAQNPL